jgi:hypothetical protein
MRNWLIHLLGGFTSEDVAKSAELYKAWIDTLEKGATESRSEMSVALNTLVNLATERAPREEKTSVPLQTSRQSWPRYKKQAEEFDREKYWSEKMTKESHGQTEQK